MNKASVLMVVFIGIVLTGIYILENVSGIQGQIDGKARGDVSVCPQYGESDLEASCGDNTMKS